MTRRTCLLSALMLPAVTLAETKTQRIQLHVDLTVDPDREREMLKSFQEVFRPAARRQPGYIDVQLFKLRSTLMGKPPGDANYRFVLTFESEELRQKWVASDVHQKVWPTIEKCLKHRNYSVLLYDYPQI
jgi:antibiotic biosynthesis monooxygenase (ABM) superfamily enzyme